MIMMSEFLEIGSRHVFLGLLLLPWGLSTLISTILFDIYEYWKMLTMYIVAIAGVALVPLFYTDESPRYFAAIKGQYKIAKDIINQISASNNTVGFEGHIEGENSPHS